MRCMDSVGRRVCSKSASFFQVKPSAQGVLRDMEQQLKRAEELQSKIEVFKKEKQRDFDGLRSISSDFSLLFCFCLDVLGARFRDL